MRISFDRQRGVALLRAGAAYATGDGRGLAGSLALHGLFVLAILLLFLLHTAPAPSPPSRLVPIDVVNVGDETTSPPTARPDRIPQPLMPRTTPRPPASADKPEGTSPTGTRPVDEVETRLRALAQLKQPESNLADIETPGATDAPAGDAAPGDEAAYAVRDLIRAQILRRWTFNATELGGKGFDIALRIVVLRNGRVAKAEILDRARFTRDALYRDIALSARNAVLLSSPLTLPSRSFGDQLEMTLTLNPRDTLR